MVIHFRNTPRYWTERLFYETTRDAIIENFYSFNIQIIKIAEIFFGIMVELFS